MFAVIAVVSVGVAAFGALTSRVVIGAVGSVLALAALVAARRFEQPHAPPADAADGDAADGEPADEPADEPLSGRELGARILALVAGVLVLSAVTFALLRWQGGALGAGLMGIGMLLAAKRLVPVAGAPEPEPGPSPSPRLRCCGRSCRSGRSSRSRRSATCSPSPGSSSTSGSPAGERPPSLL